MLTKLCCKDEYDLKELLKNLADGLVKVGIEGDVKITITKESDIFADININEESKLKLKIADDGNEEWQRYEKNDTR